jgi:type IX secretion system PorP/SprF family membrane protein
VILQTIIENIPMKKNKLTIILLSFTLCFGFYIKADAQNGVFGSAWFQNQYLFNPAMSGLNAQEFNLNTAYQAPFNSVPGGPRALYATADYGFNNQVGAGLSVINDKEGLFSNTRIAATYSFHIKAGEQGQQINFGVSAVGILEKLNTYDITGNPNDPLIYNFNDRSMQFEADFGAAYTDDKLTAQATVPNMVALFGNRQRDVFEAQTLFVAVAYKVNVDDSADGIAIEPKLACRGYKGYQNVVDGGANVIFLKDVFSVYGLYHTSKTVSFGLGLKFLDALQLTAAYNTQTSPLQNFPLSNSFEVGLRYFVK